MAVDALQTSLLGTTTLGGRYRPIRHIGSGGMANVWDSEDLVLHRRVAVKLLSPAMCDNEPIAARFRREAQAAGRLAHPNIAAVYDFGEEQGCPFIVMELVPGRTLRRVLDERTRLPVDEAVDIAAQVADALAAAHAEGVVHRDVKPGNVMLTDDGRVKVMDFGVADASWFEPITDTGVVMATARYISPEQATGSSGSAASDVYSLGVVLYEMLAGRPPFEGSSPFAVAAAHAYEVPPPVTRFAPSLPGSVAAVVDAATRKDPRDRPSAVALRERLRDALGSTGTIPLASAAHRDRTAVLSPASVTTATGRGAGWLRVAAVALGFLLLLLVIVATSGRGPDRAGADAPGQTGRETPAVAVETGQNHRGGASPSAGASEHGQAPDHGRGDGNPNGNAFGHDKEQGKGNGDD
jgi:serine/threonine-protein kinase